MANRPIEVAAFSAVYVGDSTSSSQLTYISTLRTGGATLNYTIPESFFDVATNSLQTDYAKISINLQFLSDDDTAVKLAMGNLPSTTNPDDSSTFSTLSVLLLHPDGANGNHSIYIPKCYAKKEVNLNYNKDKVTIVPLSLSFQNRNRFTPLFYKRDNTSLKSIMGSKSPY